MNSHSSSSLTLTSSSLTLAELAWSILKEAEITVHPAVGAPLNLVRQDPSQRSSTTDDVPQPNRHENSVVIQTRFAILWLLPSVGKVRRLPTI